MLGSLTSYWGKLQKDPQTERVLSWHPLEDHCADVASCCEALLQQSNIRSRLARLAGLSDLSEVQSSRLCVLAALHDIGKFNHGFQNKKYPKGKAPTAGHVKEVLAIFQGQGRPEETFLAEAIEIEELTSWANDDSLCDLLFASICHHGKPNPVGVDFQEGLWKTSPQNPFTGIENLLHLTKKWFPKAFQQDGTPLPAQTELQHAFSGLVMLADWLGSDTDFFPYSDSINTDRISFSRAKAKEATERIGIFAEKARSLLRPSQFQSLFGFEPRGAQKVVCDLPLPEPNTASIVILEAETGSGKTEAALSHYAKLFSQGRVDGLYFALPTRTAATQIYNRVYKNVERFFHSSPERPPVVLAVPGYLSVDETKGDKLPNFEVLWHDNDKERFRFRGWAAENPKRYLAGAIVVGTIDQVLLSALQVSHAHLRATALLRHLLVVDEVHASDAYMNRLLEEVLARHLKAGGHALLMSATLGSETKQRLLTPNQLPKIPKLNDAEQESYPLVIHRIKKLTTYPVPKQGEVQKEIRVQLASISAAHREVAARALLAAQKGAKVLVIRNTVKECVETQQELEALAQQKNLLHLCFSCHQALAPHHARFTKEDRTSLDDALEINFGKNSKRMIGCVAVATQTVQQSLDLDADLLLTDLCPMDVLLQRIGRLHRHRENQRHPEFQQATVVVLVPEERKLTSLLRGDRVYGKHGFGSVYEDLRILETTWALLESHSLLKIPEMNRPLVERSTHPEALAALGEEWKKFEQSIWGKTIARRQQAVTNGLRWDKPFGDPESLFPAKELDRRIMTRLGEGDRIALFSVPLVGPFGNWVRQLTLPAHYAQDASPEEVPQNIKPLPKDHAYGKGLAFSFAKKEFVYDRLGLRPQTTQAEEESDA
jgi:CRISPR-associated endonuclease/helicase Cas3